MKKIVVGQNIVKSFGDGSEATRVLNGVSVDIHEGEFVSVMGPSGSGKSTLMFALSGMDFVDSGDVTFEGKSIAGLKERELADLRRTRMGFVFQQPTLLRNLSILDNIVLPTMRDNKANAAQITERALELMARMGIVELANRDITQVSGGQLQRAGICRALMSNPRIIFGDEPTGALNSKAAHEIIDILASINADGTAVMLVTHDPKVAAQTERVMFMADGAIVRETKFAKQDDLEMDERIRMVTAEMRDIGV